MTTKRGKHTPSWAVMDDKVSRALWVRDGINGDVCDLYSRIGDKCIRYENAETNAHLIASAPLMYSILKRIQKDGFDSIGDVEIEDALIQAEGRV